MAFTAWLDRLFSALAGIGALLGAGAAFAWLSKMKAEKAEREAFQRRQQETVEKIEDHLDALDEHADAIAAEKTAKIIAEGTQLAQSDHLAELLEEAGRSAVRGGTPGEGPGAEFTIPSAPGPESKDKP